MQQIDEAVADAEMLLGHAARRGLALSPEHATAIIALRRTHQPTVDEETRFWVALSAVAKAVQPVTVASLKAGSPANGQARRAVWHYRRWAYGALACLALMQIYTVIGAKSVADLDAIPKDLVEKADRLSAILQLQASDGKAMKAADAAELRSLQTVLQFQKARLEASYGMLQLWRLAWHPLLVLQTFVPHIREASAATDLSKLRAPSNNEPTLDQYTPSQITEIRLKAEFALLALQDYALPFLYGLLGACIFILRSLSNEVKAISFVSDEDYQLRLPLGALSGVAIAWFLGVIQSAKGVQSVSPLPLAFLAGYSVEILFTALDRLVGAFSSDSGVAPRATP